MHEYRKAERSPEEAARLRADRERYQKEKKSPLQLLAEGGHDDFIPLGALLELHQAMAWLKKERERQGDSGGESRSHIDLPSYSAVSA